MTFATYGGSAGGIVSLLQTGGGFFLISAVLALVLPERGFTDKAIRASTVHCEPEAGALR